MPILEIDFRASAGSRQASDDIGVVENFGLTLRGRDDLSEFPLVRLD